VGGGTGDKAHFAMILMTGDGSWFWFYKHHWNRQ